MSSKSEKDLEFIFNENGVLSQVAENYEYRQEQKDMALSVLAALENNEFSLIDAPTGVGKSLAYLIPSFLYAVENNERVVIATDTNALLYQLASKDIPLVQKILKTINPSMSLSYACLQGKNRYLCYSRYKTFLSQLSQNLFNIDIDYDDYNYLENFHSHTKYSCMDEIDFSQSWIYKIWDEINICESGMCRNCEFKTNECHYYSKLIKKAYSCNVLITNHSLILSDAKIKREDEETLSQEYQDGLSCLPKYSKLIIDEAHALTKNCEKIFEIEYSTQAITSVLLHLISKEKNLFSQLANISLSKTNTLRPADDFDINKAILFTTKIETIVRLNKKIENDIIIAFQNLPVLCKEIGFKELGLGDETIKVMLEIEHQLASLIVDFDSVKRSDENSFIIDEIKRYMKVLQNASEALDCALNSNMIFNSPTIHWIEILDNQREQGRGVLIKAVPIFASYKLNDLLYNDLSSCVFTSATLDTGDDFNFYLTNAGIDCTKKNVNKFILPSPFDYKKNTIQLFVNDLDTSKQFKEANEKCSDFIAKAITYSNGGGLILFTSFSSLNAMYTSVEKKLKGSKIKLLLQGSGESNSALIEKFKKDKDSVLFATSSFWQGVDFSGETLRLLVVHKMPFAVPSTPIHRAREFELAKQGKKYFYEYDIPDVIIKMRQGIGRLMRKSTDKGIIAILDGRIVNNNFYKSKIYPVLDKDNSHITNSQEALEYIKDFFSVSLL